MMTQLVSALIGAGGIAKALHLPAHKNLTGSSLKWVCDVNEEQARQTAEKFGIANWTCDMNKVLEDSEVQWVDVAVPNQFHESVTIAALAAGKHVLCQKPMADSAEAAKRMVEAANRHKRQLGVYMCFRGDPGLQLLRQLMKDGCFGGIISFRGKMISANGYNLKDGHWRMDGASGALDLLGIHLIDLFSWLHSDIQWVQAYSNTLHAQMKGDDVTSAIYGFADGVTAIMETTYCSYVNENTPLYDLEINGTQGFAKYNLESGRMTIQLKESVQMENFNCPAAQINHFQFPHTLSGGAALPNMHQEFVDCLLQERKFETDGQTGYQAVRITEATLESAKSGKRVFI